MQLGRSYSRRLKSVKYEIYELYPSARHAYNIIRPAVKTSRPHVIPGKVGISFDKELFFFKDLNAGSRCRGTRPGFRQSLPDKHRDSFNKASIPTRIRTQRYTKKHIFARLPNQVGFRC